jgi:D-glycero-D-manno-heptose 1,7-bisphosphate phosphatase
MKLNKAAFFDRDGTIIKDVPYLSSIDDIQLIPQAVIIAHLCQKQGYKLFVVTNQSGVARGIFEESFVHKAHAYITDLFIKHGIRFEKFYYCPHHPTEAVTENYKKDCFCRKPKPGMLVTAAQEYNLDLSQSILFGDRETDLAAGRAVGCKDVNITELFALPHAQCGTL